MACGHLSVLGVYFIHFYPCWPPWNLWLKNLPKILIKIMCFEYPPHGLSIQFPLITQVFHIFDMHDFKACQISHFSHLWNIGSWNWHICSHVTLIAVCHYFRVLIELPSCFYFQTVYFCFFNITNKTAKDQTNITANRADIFNISCCKVPLIYFSKYWWHFTVKKISCQLFNKYVPELPFFRGFRIRTIRTIIHSQLIFQ